MSANIKGSPLQRASAILITSNEADICLFQSAATIILPLTPTARHHNVHSWHTVIWFYHSHAYWQSMTGEMLMQVNSAEPRLISPFEEEEEGCLLWRRSWAENHIILWKQEFRLLHLKRSDWALSIGSRFKNDFYRGTLSGKQAKHVDLESRGIGEVIVQ